MVNLNITRADVQKAIAEERAKLTAVQADHQTLSGADCSGCIACKAGLHITLAAVITAALRLSPAAIATDSSVVTIAAATGLSTTVVASVVTIAVAAIVTGVSVAVDEIISKLCELMGACSG